MSWGFPPRTWQGAQAPGPTVGGSYDSRWWGTGGSLAVEAAPPLGLTPQPEECVKGATATEMVSLNPGGTPTSKEGTGAQEALSLRVSPALGPLAGLCLLRLGLGHPGLGCSEMRGPRGCPTGPMGSATLEGGGGRRKGLNRGPCGPGWTLPPFLTLGWGGNCCFLEGPGSEMASHLL